MPAPIPSELREIACNLAMRGEFTQEKVVELLEGYGSTSSIKRWVKQLRETGTLEPKSGKRGPRPFFDEARLSTIKSIVEERPDRTLLEISEEFTSRTGLPTSTSAVSRALASLGFTRKKNARSC